MGVGESIRVLIVDDDPGVRQFLSALLKRDGIAVTIAEDGEAAIARIGRERFDVILLDLLMPRVDGMGVLRFMKERAISIPVVVVSAVTDELGAALDPQLVRVTMRKPVNPADLRSVVTAVLAESRSAEGVGEQA